MAPNELAFQVAELDPPLPAVTPEPTTLTLPESWRAGDCQLALSAPGACEKLSSTCVVGKVGGGGGGGLVAELQEAVPVSVKVLPVAGRYCQP